MNISAWAIKRPTPVILFFLIVTLLGIFSFQKLGIDDNPNIDLPVIVVTIGQPGAAPKELETDVTKKVEDALIGIAGMQHMTSTVTDGSSVTSIEFDVGYPTMVALNDVRDAVSKIRQTLPQDINEPSITHPNFSGAPFIVYSVESPTRSVEQLSYFIDNTITRELLTVPGVGQVLRAGGLDREIRVELNPERLRAIGVTSDQISTQIKSLNINVPGGRADTGSQEQTIRTIGSAETVDQLRNLQIYLPNGQSVKLEDLGKVLDSTAEVRQMARLNGKPVVSFAVARAQGASLISAEEGTRKKIEELNKTIPSDIKIKLVRNSARFTRDSYHASTDALYLGAALAIIVIFIFLRNWQATLIGALAIPLSILGTFAVMQWLGYTLNGITLLAMILVVGILVDDAIVDLENIHRHIAMGKTPLQAAFDATDEIGLAVVATTFTIVAVFIPVAFMGGIPGQFFRAFGITVSVAVLFSLVVARTLTPMMGANLLPEHAVGEDEKESRMQRVYRVILSTALKHRIITMILAVFVFAGSMMLVPLVPKTFIDNGDISEASLVISLPSGSTIKDTERVVNKVQNLISKRKEVLDIYSNINVNSATVNIIMVQPEERDINNEEFENELLPALSDIPGARLAFSHGGAGGGATSKPVNIILRSADSNLLNNTSSTLLSQMRGLSELRDVTSSASELRPEIIVLPDFQRAADQGVSVTTIARIARIGTQGDVDVNLPKFNAGERQINIRVKLEESARTNIESIENLLIPSKNGFIPLKSVAEVRLSSGPVQIDRYDRNRQITISGNLNNGVLLGQATDAVNKLPIMQKLPTGVSSGNLGQAKIMADVFGEFAKALLSALLFIYAVLVLLFGSFLHPITIMVALPLSVGGAMAGLLVFHKALGLMALIGIVMLMGIVTKNSILLVEYAIMSEREGKSKDEAIMASGLARLRPIIMTTIAMISGMLPIALSIGAGTESKSPMAVAVIGGLTTSTIFTLVVVPAIYSFVDDFKHFISRIFKKKKKESKNEIVVSDNQEGTL